MRRSTLFLALLGIAACGGKKHADTGPTDEGGGGDDTTASEDPCNGGMCSPETLQNIQSSLDRKRETATRCLTKAIDDGNRARPRVTHTRLRVGLTN